MAAGGLRNAERVRTGRVSQPRPLPPEWLFPERVRILSDRLSPGQQRAARFCLTQPQAAVRLAAAGIGREVGVSESTVIRLAATLGYDGFPGMRDALRTQLEPVPAPRRAGRQARGIERHAQRSLEMDQRTLQETVNELSLPAIVEAARILLRAPRVFVIAFRSTFTTAFAAAFHLKQLRADVHLIGGSADTFPEDLAEMRAGDALLAISVPPYMRRTVRTVDYARGQGLHTLAITDGPLSPIAGSEVTIFARHQSGSFFNSNVALLAVVNAIASVAAELAEAGRPDVRVQLLAAFNELELPPRALEPERPRKARRAAHPAPAR
jgi:DNA-binding MurR/RpiR family transcriptional regulator